MKTKLRKITQDIRKHGDPEKWVYRVSRRGKSLRITVRIRSRFLIYPKPIGIQRLITELSADQTFELSPGQWCEIWFEGTWCTMIDADCREQASRDAPKTDN